MDNSIDVITNNIQLALAPVFLLTAVATLFNAISTRLGRTVDRMRAIHKELQDGHVIDHQIHQLMRKEANESKFRGRLCTMAIFFDVLSGVFISDRSRDLFFYTHALVISFALAFFWDRFKSVFKGHILVRGLEFGAVYSLTGLLPILWMTYSQIDVSSSMVLSWFGFGFFQSSVAGIIFAKMNP
jgi:hypothetical protein